jgi:hypothetical protein
VKQVIDVAKEVTIAPHRAADPAVLADDASRAKMNYTGKLNLPNLKTE